MYGKPVAWLNVAAEGRGLNAHASLAMVLGYVGAAVVEEACAAVPVPRESVGPDGLVVDVPVRRAIADVVRRFVDPLAAILTSNDSISMLYTVPPTPRTRPIGLQLARTAKAVSRAFDDALVDGGRVAAHLARPRVAQGAASPACSGTGGGGRHRGPDPHPSPQPHGDRRPRHPHRDPRNRRVHRVELTAEGEALFHRLLQAVITFDRRLRAGSPRRGHRARRPARPAAGQRRRRDHRQEEVVS